MNKNEIIEFSIENIDKFLNENKNILVNMNLSLDSHEISKSLTGSLNRSLMGNKTKLSEVYDYISNNFDEISNKVKIIEDKIKEFNNQQKSGYFIDPDNILLLVFFKQFIYVQKLILEISTAINAHINLIFIYTYLISKLYDQPHITSNYIFIIQKMIKEENFDRDYCGIFKNFDKEYCNEFKNFISENNINKIYFIINNIYQSDTIFSKLVEELKNKKIEEYIKINIVDYSDSEEKIKKEYKNIKGGESDTDKFYNIEQKYIIEKNYLLLTKRDIDISTLYSEDFLNFILKDSISVELWFGYNLFIYKRFNFNFNDYQIKINEIIKNKLDNIYLLNVNYLKDLDVPDAGILLPSMIGGFNNNNKHYRDKYLKYKKKYLALKQKNMFNQK
jgi:hypothetical protein